MIINRDIRGQKFHRLRALSFQFKNKHGYNCWKFKCDCGKTIICTGSEVWRERRKSCGCYRKEVNAVANLKHGCKGKRIYRIWSGMKQRCGNSSHTAYSRYGGRNIKVCRRWYKFENFLKDMGYPPSWDYTLDRVNNSLGYCLKNCRWASKKEQNRNSRANIRYTVEGKTKCLAEIAEDHNLNYFTLWTRLRKRGWSLTRALNEPLHTEKVRSFAKVLE